VFQCVSEALNTQAYGEAHMHQDHSAEGLKKNKELTCKVGILVSWCSSLCFRMRFLFQQEFQRALVKDFVLALAVCYGNM